MDQEETDIGDRGSMIKVDNEEMLLGEGGGDSIEGGGVGIVGIR